LREDFDLVDAEAGDASLTGAALFAFWEGFGAATSSFCASDFLGFFELGADNSTPV